MPSWPQRVTRTCKRKSASLTLGKLAIRCLSFGKGDTCRLWGNKSAVEVSFERWREAPEWDLFLQRNQPGQHKKWAARLWTQQHTPLWTHSAASSTRRLYDNMCSSYQATLGTENEGAQEPSAPGTCTEGCREFLHRQSSAAWGALEQMTATRPLAWWTGPDEHWKQSFSY